MWPPDLHLGCAARHDAAKLGLERAHFLLGNPLGGQAAIKLAITCRSWSPSGSSSAVRRSSTACLLATASWASS